MFLTLYIIEIPGHVGRGLHHSKTWPVLVLLATVATHNRTDGPKRGRCGPNLYRRGLLWLKEDPRRLGPSSDLGPIFSKYSANPLSFCFQGASLLLCGNARGGPLREVEPEGCLWKHEQMKVFLVADTQLYKSLCCLCCQHLPSSFRALGTKS